MPSAQPTPNWPTMSREELVELGAKLDGVEIVYKRAALAGSGHQGREAGRAHGGVLVLLGGLSGLALLGGLPVLAVGVQAATSPRASPLLAGHPAVRPDVRAVDSGHRHRRGAVPEEVHPRGDLDPGPPRRRAPRDRPQDRRRRADRRAGELNAEAPQADRPVAGPRAGRVRPRHAGRLRRRPDQEPVEAGVPTPTARRRCCGPRAGPRASTARPSTWPAPPGGPASRRSSRCGPRIIDAGGMETVFPWRESDGDGTTVESHDKLTEIADGRPQPGHADPHQARGHVQGGQAPGPGELQLRRLFAFTEDLHAPGLPVLAVRAADLSHPVPVPPVAVRRACTSRKPIFGPAARALAQLPITIDTEGYLVANGDFIEPLGPAFWERRS